MHTLKINREIEFDANILKDMCVNAGFSNTLLDYDRDWLGNDVTEVILHLNTTIEQDEPETEWVDDILDEMLKIDGVNNATFQQFDVTPDSYKIRLIVALDGILYNEYDDRVR